MRYIIGALLVLSGAVMVLKSEWFYQNFGSISWAEENLGTSGGSRLLYKIIGLILIFVGMLLITGMMQGFLMATIGRLFVH